MSDMKKKREVVDYIIKNRLSDADAKAYAKKQGVSLIFNDVPLASGTELEAGQRFVYRGEDNVLDKPTKAK